jgi:hypothetical protein
VCLSLSIDCSPSGGSGVDAESWNCCVSARRDFESIALHCTFPEGFAVVAICRRSRSSSFAGLGRPSQLSHSPVIDLRTHGFRTSSHIGTRSCGSRYRVIRFRQFRMLWRSLPFSLFSVGLTRSRGSLAVSYFHRFIVSLFHHSFITLLSFRCPTAPNHFVALTASLFVCSAYLGRLSHALHALVDFARSRAS